MLYLKEKKSEIRSKTMLKLDSIKAEIPAVRPVLAEVGVFLCPGLTEIRA